MDGSIIVVKGSRLTFVCDEHKPVWKVVCPEHIPEFSLEHGDVCRIVMPHRLVIVVYRRGSSWVISDDKIYDERVIELETFKEVRAALRVMECSTDAVCAFAALVARDPDVTAELNSYLSVADDDIIQLEQPS